MASPTTQQLLEEYTGKVVPYTFNGGFVCLSYAISLVGTGTTLELIRRRTSHRGKHNFFLLVGAAIAMGGIAIWSMHFIGNRAIYMLNGEAAFQIAYSTALTVASLIVPILVLVLAFVGVNGNGRIQWWRIVLAGLLSGGAICGMHYLADASISNYRGSYRLSYLIGSIIIAVLASTTALTLFFVFENTWSSAWWKRLGCAMVLAGAVSGMHWCAAVGTSYTLLHDKPGKGVSRKDAMVVVICLSIAAGVVMTGMAIYSTWVRRDYASKSQQVVLAAGVFDDKGRIMVSQDGYLPSEVVTDTYFTKSNDDVFNTSHPLFHWMFRASRNWDTMTKVMTKMSNHISLLAQDRNIGRAGIQLISDDGELVDEYDTILRELFCVTADALASKTKETLTGVGTLWDEIFVTGESSRVQRLFNNDMPGSQSVAEKGIQQNGQEYGRGSLMFLVRRVDSRKEVVRLEASGFRFVEVHQVAPFIRSTMRIKTPDLEAHLRNMANQRDKTPMLSPGFQVGMFAVRARLDRGGFDVLAQKTARNLLPSVPLPVSTLDASNANFLNRLRGLPLSTILLKLQSYESASAQDRMFASILRDAVSSLRDSLGDETFDNATLLPKVVQLPCATSPAQGKFLSKCILIAFQLVLPIHATVLSPDCEFTPLNFFKIRQLTYEGSSHNIEFSHMVHRDMSSTVHELSSPPRRFSVAAQVNNKLFSRAAGKVRNNLPGHKRHATALVLSPTRSQEQLSKSVSHPSSIYNGDDGSFDFARKLSSASQSHSGKDSHKDQGTTKLHVLGGIMVSQEVSINVQDNQEDSNAPEQKGSELRPIRPRADAQGKMESFYTATATVESGFAGQGKQDESAFVDELLALSMQADKRATG